MRDERHCIAQDKAGKRQPDISSQVLSQSEKLMKFFWLINLNNSQHENGVQLWRRRSDEGLPTKNPAQRSNDCPTEKRQSQLYWRSSHPSYWQDGSCKLLRARSWHCDYNARKVGIVDRKPIFVHDCPSELRPCSFENRRQTALYQCRSNDLD